MTALSPASLSTSTSPTRDPAAAGSGICNKIGNGGELETTPVIKGLDYAPAIIASNDPADARSGPTTMPLPPLDQVTLELPTPHYEANSIANDDDDAFMQFSGSQVCRKFINLTRPRAPETFLGNIFSIILRLSARRGGINSTNTNFEGLLVVLLHLS